MNRILTITEISCIIHYIITDQSSIHLRVETQILLIYQMHAVHKYMIRMLR